MRKVWGSIIGVAVALAILAIGTATCLIIPAPRGTGLSDSTQVTPIAAMAPLPAQVLTTRLLGGAHLAGALSGMAILRLASSE